MSIKSGKQASNWKEEIDRKREKKKGGGGRKSPQFVLVMSCSLPVSPPILYPRFLSTLSIYTRERRRRRGGLSKHTFLKIGITVEIFEERIFSVLEAGRLCLGYVQFRLPLRHRLVTPVFHLRLEFPVHRVVVFFPTHWHCYEPTYITASKIIIERLKNGKGN
jgi:hypothetical protein